MKLLRILTVSGCLLAATALLPEAGGQPEQPKQAKQKAGPRPGEINTPPARGERPAERLKQGDPAPDFTLADPTGKREVRLSHFQGKKPVVLIFGSHT